MLVAGLILLKTSFSSLTLKVIFLLKTSILEWAVDKNGRPRIKGTSSSSAGKASKPSFLQDLARLSDLYFQVLIEAPRFLIVASVEAQISLIMFEFSSFLLADSAINLVSDSSSLGLRCSFRSGYDVFSIVLVDVELGLDIAQQARQKVFVTSGSLKMFPLDQFLVYSAYLRMSILAISGSGGLFF
ncbi:hypothetical protein Tco_0609543 [Tanacetum coccineum]